MHRNDISKLGELPYQDIFPSSCCGGVTLLSHVLAKLPIVIQNALELSTQRRELLLHILDIFDLEDGERIEKGHLKLQDDDFL